MGPQSEINIGFTYSVVHAEQKDAGTPVGDPREATDSTGGVEPLRVLSNCDKQAGVEQPGD